MKRTKLFKIGEYAQGGHIRLTLFMDAYAKETLKWEIIDMYSGKVEEDGIIHGSNVLKQIEEYIFELAMTNFTTSYYCGEMFKWIRKQRKVILC